jgi:dihydropteroate synthase
MLTPDQAQALDNQLSNRSIPLDPNGYFLIYLDRDQGQICADHYSNTIDETGIACDPETGEPLPCNTNLKRQPTRQYRGHTAKELCIEVFEKNTPLISKLDHAAYLGREFIRAEIALYNHQKYIQD